MIQYYTGLLMWVVFFILPTYVLIKIIYAICWGLKEEYECFKRESKRKGCGVE